MTSVGTPFSPSATKILLRGSGERGKEVVIELQRFGCEVIACDRRYSNIEAALNAPDTQLRRFGKPEVKGKRRMDVVLARGTDIEIKPN